MDSNPKIEIELSEILKEIKADLSDLKISVAKLEEKVDGLSKRLDDQAFVNRGVLIGLIVAICGGAAKLFGFVS